MRYLLRKLGRKIRRLFKRDYTIYSRNEAESLTTTIMSYILDYGYDREELRHYISNTINSEVKWLALRFQVETRNDIGTMYFEDELQPDVFVNYAPIIKEKK